MCKKNVNLTSNQTYCKFNIICVAEWDSPLKLFLFLKLVSSFLAGSRTGWNKHYIFQFLLTIRFGPVTKFWLVGYVQKFYKQTVHCVLNRKKSSASLPFFHLSPSCCLEYGGHGDVLRPSGWKQNVVVQKYNYSSKGLWRTNTMKKNPTTWHGPLLLTSGALINNKNDLSSLHHRFLVFLLFFLESRINAIEP